MSQLGLFDKKQAIIRETRLIECWCPSCSKGQMKQILELSFREKKALIEYIGMEFTCENCKSTYEIADHLSIIPEGFLISSYNDMSRVKMNADLHQHLNEEPEGPYDGDEIMKDLDILNKSAEQQNKFLEGMLKKINAGSVADTVVTDEVAEVTVPEYSDDVTTVLKGCTVEGLVVKLPPEQLNRDLYKDVKNALELIGGKWKGGKVSGFVFKEDPTDLLAQIANGVKRNLKKEFQFFGTPDSLADKMVAMAEIQPEHKRLEPHGGQGAIIKAMHRADPACVVHTYELMDLNRSVLDKMQGVAILGNDFLKADVSVKYDRIVANPPFTKNQDIDHIYLMYHLLAPGGVMVTLSSPSWTFSSKTKPKEFREWLHGVNAHIEEIPENAFKESGTNIRTMLIKIRKPE